MIQADTRIGVRVAAQDELDFTDGRGVLETLMAGLGVRSFSLNESDGSGFGHPGRSASIEIADVHTGALMEVHPSIAEAFDLRVNGVAILESIELNNLTLSFTGATGSGE